MTRAGTRSRHGRPPGGDAAAARTYSFGSWSHWPPFHEPPLSGIHFSWPRTSLKPSVPACWISLTWSHIFPSMSCVTPAPASRGRRVDGVWYTKRTFENSSVSWPVPRILRSGARARVRPPVNSRSAASAHCTHKGLLLGRSGRSLLDVGRHRCALPRAEGVAHSRSTRARSSSDQSGCRLETDRA